MGDEIENTAFSRTDKDQKEDSKIRTDGNCDDGDKIPITTTTTKNALITTQLGPCESHAHRVKVSIVGTGNVGTFCAICILMRRIASEVCLIDKDVDKAKAEAEDIQHAGVFLGNPLVTGTSDISMVKNSSVVVIAACDPKPGEEVDVKKNLEIFKKIIPAITKFACKSVLLVVTQPIDIMSYITWKLSKFPTNRVLGVGTLLDTVRLQYYLSQRLGLANSSLSCVSIGAQGDQSVPVWSSVHVAGTKLRDINSRFGDKDDLERWHEVAAAVHDSDRDLNEKKGQRGPICRALGLCTAEIIDCIVRNTKSVLPVSTYIRSCVHGTDKDVYMSVPCVIGREGVHRNVRQKLTEQEKTDLQACADDLRNTLRECGILREPNPEDSQE